MTGGGQNVNDELAEIVPIAVAIAISPIPIGAVIVMLMSDRGGANALGFLVGWALGLAAICGLVAALELGAGLEDKEPGAGFLVAQVAVAITLLIAGAVSWRRRGLGESGVEARWLAAARRISPAGAVALGLAFIVLNLKDALLTVAAGAEVGQLDAPTGTQVVAVAVFVLVASSTILLPTAVAAALGPRATEPLQRSQAALERHGGTVTAVILIGLGVLVAVDVARAV